MVKLSIVDSDNAAHTPTVSGGNAAADPAHGFSTHLTLEASYEYCESLCHAKSNNYPIASFFAQSSLRKHIFAVFAYARVADDYADEPQYEGRRASALDEWETMLTQTYFGQVPAHPVFVALADTIDKHELPLSQFKSLLDGLRADIENRSYATYGELSRHLRQVTAPLGHLFLMTAGERDVATYSYAEDLAAGLALTRLLQHLAADIERGRFYIPGEDLRHFGVTKQDLIAGHASPGLHALIRFQVARARASFMRARPLADKLGPQTAVEVALMWHGGWRTLDKIDRLGAHVIQRPPKLSRADKAWALARAIAWRGSSLGPRAVAQLRARFF